MIVNATEDGLEFGIAPGGGGAVVHKGARASFSPFISATAGSWVPVAYDAEQFDTDGFVDLAANNTRITIPSGVTKIRFYANVIKDVGGSTANDEQWQIFKNGASMSPSAGDFSVETPSGGYSNSGVTAVSGMMDVVAGDYFELRLFQAVANAHWFGWFEVEVLEGSVLNSGGGGASALNDLTDVSTTGGSTGDALIQQNDGTFALQAPAGGGLFRGENGLKGNSTTGAGDIFRVHEKTLNTNVTIAGTENAVAAGPLEIATGVTLTVAAGGSLAIV